MRTLLLTAAAALVCAGCAAHAESSRVTATPPAVVDGATVPSEPPVVANAFKAAGDALSTAAPAPSDAATDAAHPSPCVLDAAEAAHASGMTIVRTKSVDDAQCAYFGDNDENGRFSLTISWTDAPTAYSAFQGANEIAQQVAKPHGVDGLGDKAMFGVLDRMLIVEKGDRAFTVTNLGSASADAMVGVARAVVAKW